MTQVDHISLSNAVIEVDIFHINATKMISYTSATGIIDYKCEINILTNVLGIKWKPGGVIWTMSVW